MVLNCFVVVFKDIYRFVFTKIHFIAAYSLHTLFPNAHEIRLSSFTAGDLVADRSFGGSTVMVQISQDGDIDDFFDLLELEDAVVSLIMYNIQGFIQACPQPTTKE